MTELFFCDTVQLLLILEIEFQKLKVQLNYHCFQCLCFFMHTLFWLVLGSSLVNITNFTLSKLRYLILFLQSQSFCHCSLVPLCGASHPAGPHALAYYLMMTSGLAPFFVWSCRLPWNGPSCHIYCIVCHTQDTASVGALCHRIYHSLLIAIFLVLPIITMLCLSLLIESNFCIPDVV